MNGAEDRKERDTIARRKYYGKVRAENRVRRNHEIRVPNVRLINQNGEQVGVLDRREALRMAENAGLDLVEIKPELDPPLCKIMDFGKFKYEQSKKKSAATKTTKSNEPKEVRLGRGAKIDVADLKRRVGQARKFLMEGHPVNFVQRFRGREMAHPEIGLDRLKGIMEDLADIAKVQSPPKMTGRQMNMLLVPDKKKVEVLKRREAAAKKDADEGSEAKPANENKPDEQPATEGDAEGGDADAQVSAQAQ